MASREAQIVFGASLQARSSLNHHDDQELWFVSLDLLLSKLNISWPFLSLSPPLSSPSCVTAEYHELIFETHTQELEVADIFLSSASPIRVSGGFPPCLSPG
jgi:hypothetical protein